MFFIQVICKRVSKESWHCFICNFLFIFIGIRKELGSNERRVWRYQRVNHESVYRRTDNTMAKRKSTKRPTTIYKAYI